MNCHVSTMKGEKRRNVPKATELEFELCPQCQVVCVLYSAVRHTCSPPRPPSLEESYAQPTFKEWGLMFLLLKGRVSTYTVWSSSVWEICLLSFIC